LAALQTMRSGVAPKAPLLPKTSSVRPSAAPKSVVPAADELRNELETSKKSSLRPPRLPRQAEALPLVPRWEVNTTPLEPAGGQRKQFWLRVVGTSFAAGFCLGAGYLAALAQQPAHASMLDFGAQNQRAPRSLALPLTAAAPLIATPVLTSTAPKPMAAESPVVALAAAAAATAPAGVETSKAERDEMLAKLSAKSAKKALSTRALRIKAKAAPAVQAEEEAADDSSEAEADEPQAPLARTAPAENLPEQPTRSDVQKGLEGVRSMLASCAGGQHGTSYANVTIEGSGRVSYSTIEGAFAGTPAGSCMARALRTSDFPKFSGAALKVRYPFVF
jgi:hypothetical protein